MSREIDVANIALFKAGSKSIRSFDENAKTRTIEKIYVHVRDSLLSGYDWTFARKTTKLTALDTGEFDMDNRGLMLPYQYPSDCLHPVDILPEGSFTKWSVEGRVIWTAKIDPELKYIVSDLPSSYFSSAFIEAVACEMAVNIAPPLRQSDIRVKELKEAAELALVKARDNDASFGSDSIHPDMDPDNDSFVNPDRSSEAVDLSIVWKDDA